MKKDKKIWIATVQNKSKIHIPQALRDYFGVKVGGQVAFILENDVIYMRPIDQELSDKMLGLLKNIKPTKKRLNKQR